MTEDVGEFHFCMEKALMDQVGAVFIDYDPTGSFRIYTERPLSIFTTGGALARSYNHLSFISANYNWKVGRTVRLSFFCARRAECPWAMPGGVPVQRIRLCRKSSVSIRKTI